MQPNEIRASQITVEVTDEDHREKPIAELCLWTTVKQLIFSGSGEKI